MNIYKAIKKDHEKVERLLDQLVEASESGNDRWKVLVEKIRDELIPHSRAEEALFYNPIRENEITKDVIMHAYAEHAMAETELRTLQAMELINANWTALAKKLRADLLHHVAEEESKVFMAAKQIFSDEEAEQMGAAFEQLKPFVKNQTWGGTTLDLVTNLLPKRLVDGFRKQFNRGKSDKRAA
jgi:hemerythrin superfamily protein